MFNMKINLIISAKVITNQPFPFNIHNIKYQDKKIRKEVVIKEIAP